MLLLKNPVSAGSAWYFAAVREFRQRPASYFLTLLPVPLLSMLLMSFGFLTYSLLGLVIPWIFALTVMVSLQPKLALQSSDANQASALGASLLAQAKQLMQRGLKLSNLGVLHTVLTLLAIWLSQQMGFERFIEAMQVASPTNQPDMASARAVFFMAASTTVINTWITLATIISVFTGSMPMKSLFAAWMVAWRNLGALLFFGLCYLTFAVPALLIMLLLQATLPMLGMLAQLLFMLSLLAISVLGMKQCVLASIKPKEEGGV